jgi:hypothetical protein
MEVRSWALTPQKNKEASTQARPEKGKQSTRTDKATLLPHKKNIRKKAEKKPGKLVTTRAPL